MIMVRRDEEMLSAEERYCRERLDLYRARLYSGRPTSAKRLSELERAYDSAALRLRRAKATA